MTGAEYRNRLKSVGLTQVEIAKRLHVTQQAVSLWLTGKVPLSNATKLAFERLLNERERGKIRLEG